MPTAEYLAKRRVWTENRKRKLFANKCCNSCGKPDPDFDKHPGKMCDACLARIRNKIGYNPWRPGGKGRPPRSFVSADAQISGGIPSAESDCSARGCHNCEHGHLGGWKTYRQTQNLLVATP